MPKLTIDQRPVQVAPGQTVLQAARKLGIDIPTLCYREDLPANTSCMVCLVKVNGRQRLVPSCGLTAEEGMQVESETPEVHAARRASLELLLSDHLGDCAGPCQLICPARMNIPLMLRQIAAGQLEKAIATVKADIALPAVLGRICPAPCEKGCRRGPLDGPLAICLLKRYVADVDLQSNKPYRPACAPASGKRVAVVGAGPAGLAAAYYLARRGHGVTIFDRHEQAGGMLRYGVPEDRLGREVLAAEIDQIRQLGVLFRMNTTLGGEMSLERLRRDHDAVFLAIGAVTSEQVESLALAAGRQGIQVDKLTGQTSQAGIFAGGDAVRVRRMAVRAVADGKEVACSIDQYLSGGHVTGPEPFFSSRMGALAAPELEILCQAADPGPRSEPPDLSAGYDPESAATEARRCLHCDCRKPDECRLRIYARQYGASCGRYKGSRKPFSRDDSRGEVIFEPGKCIDCGLCVQITAAARDTLGLTFIGRGFDVRVAVPFEGSLDEGLSHLAADCVRACPTGALAWRRDRQV
ncbi:MAG: FAD-dependent oxidoreductase [Sedimentisphaerales bacterium]|nr:FAD-dependent oxidoreductase [Sedimentisphaerales bacterium]